MKIVVDLDDLTSQDECNPIVDLVELKQIYPDFKVTLFTIYGECNIASLFSLSRLKWVRLAAHGFYHNENSEVLRWNEKRWYDVLSLYESAGCFERVFKAPNWEMTELGYHILKDCNWAVAVRKDQIDNLPKGIRYYCFETTPNSMHGHTWLMNAHKREGKFNWNTKDTFEFVSDNLTIKE